MANYATLKAAIQQVVKTNGNNEITGALLQQSLLAMINSLGGYYQFAGIATPSTNPGTPDQNVFYLASTAGTYANFGSLVLADGEIAILKYNGAWSKDSTGATSLENVEQKSAELNFLAFGDTAVYTITTAIARVVSTYPNYKKGGLKLTFNSSAGVVTYYLDNTVWSTTTTWKKILSENDYPLYNLSYMAGSASSPVEYATRDAARYAFYANYSLFCKFGMILTYYCTADGGWVLEQYKNAAFGYTNFRADSNWVDLKRKKDHIVSDDAPNGLLINNAVKELYIPNFSYSDAALGLIRKNYNGATSRVIAIYKAGTTTVYYQFNSTYSGNGEEIIKASNGAAYILIDWAAIAAGANISAATTANVINSKYVDISHCPRIDNYLNGAKKSEVLGFTSIREYINFDVTKGLMLDRAIKELYLPDLTETQKSHAVFGLCRKRYGTSQQWALAIYDSSNASTIETFSSANKVDAPELMRGTLNPNNAIVFDWSEVEDGGNDLGTTSIDYLINFKYNFLTFCPHIDYMRRFNTAAFGLVDDDFIETGYTRVKALCDSLGVKCDFALIPTVDGNGNYSIPGNVLSVVQTYENEGFHFQLHPPHSGWYNSGTNTYDGRAVVEDSLVKTKRAFDQNNIQHDNCLVYPGSSGSNNDVVEMAEEHCDFGLTMGRDYNIGIDKSRFALARLFIDTISTTYTKTYWKGKILAAYNAGALLVIGCHSYNFDSSGTVDESTNSWANFADIVTYANSLCKIRPIGYIFGKREPLLKLK